jgi:hypothetical protein
MSYVIRCPFPLCHTAEAGAVIITTCDNQFGQWCSTLARIIGKFAKVPLASHSKQRGHVNHDIGGASAYVQLVEVICTVVCSTQMKITPIFKVCLD